jgi:hypothetical protein
MEKAMTIMDVRVVARRQPYDVTYFAKRHGLTIGEARSILTKSGTREEANKLAEELKASKEVTRRPGNGS